MLINLNAPPKNFKRLLFPDNQPHIQLEGVLVGDGIDVVCSLIDSKRVLELIMLSNALDNQRCKKQNLYIPYLMGARFDRIMQPGDSFDLKVIANLINLLNFDNVHLFDPHSDVAPALINNSVVVTNEFLVQAYDKPNSVLIIPDAGAAKKASKYLEWNKNIVDTVNCVKHRDLSNGNITLEVLNPEKCKGKNVVIIDDLCDGGRTFTNIMHKLHMETSHPAVKTLIVTHGIFSNGFGDLYDWFDHIIVSDSYRTHHFASDEYIKTIKCPIA